jgi:hypothetical protein
MPQQYQSEKNGRRFLLEGGINTYVSQDLLPESQYLYLQNVRRYLNGRITGRATQSAPIYTLTAPPHSIRRLNDTTPAGPPSGYVRIAGAADVMSVNGVTVATGLSGNPVSIQPFRPNTSVQPWAYIGDSAPSPNVTVSSGFNCSGMIKIRSDGRTRKQGIKEPQTAPTTSFPGGGTGPVLISYKYVYVANETGALSNPSPQSVPGTNSQSNPSSTIPATAYATNYTFNASQYEFVSPQIRTKGGVGPGTTTDYVVVRGLGFSIPTNVTVNGIQVDLNWVGQNSGTGVLSGVALYYNGIQIGTPKLPGIQNQSFSTDTIQGSNSDTWGTTITPDMVNDPSFGFGVQITTQNVGGTDRSFINSMGVTVFYSTQNALITPVPSPDPQVDRIDIYRQGGGLSNYTFVGSIPNAAIAFNDTLTDLAASTNPQLQYDNFEPFPSIDLPRSGTLNASGGVLTWVSGDQFNTRWLPGTIILIGSPTQTAYSSVRRPSSTTSWDMNDNNPLVPKIPDGTNLVFTINEPGLAAQPLPSTWGPTDNTAYMFGVGDPLRPNTLYFTKGNNPDSAPDTNQIEVGEAGTDILLNGCIVGGIGMVFSTEKAWLISPTYTSAYATVSGVQGQPFQLIESIADRGLYMRNCLCTEGGINVFFRAKDGIYVSPSGQGSQSITDTTIYNLFPHEGITPSPITIAGRTVYPPDDTKPELQKLRFATGYLYYDYVDTTSTPRTLVFDVAAKGWSVDVGSPAFTCHANEEGPNVNDTIVGCADNTVRVLDGSAAESATSIVIPGAFNAAQGRALKRLGDVFFKAFANTVIALELWTNRYTNALTGYSPNYIANSGYLSSVIVDFNNGIPQDLNDIGAVLSWPTGSHTTYLDQWMPTWIDLPESIQDRATDWDNAGTDSNKFYQGLTLELDTYGAPKTFAVQDDQGNLHVPVECPVTTSIQTIKTFTFNPPFTSHQVRIVSSDGVGWSIYPSGSGDAQWTVVPYPESSTLWQAEPTTFGQIGYNSCYAVNLVYICPDPVVVTLATDYGTFTLNFPASASQLTPSKTWITAPANKWKILTFSVSSTSKVTLWKDLTEVWISNWGSTNAAFKFSPFGGNNAPSVTI